MANLSDLQALQETDVDAVADSDLSAEDLLTHQADRWSLFSRVVCMFVGLYVRKTKAR